MLVELARGVVTLLALGLLQSLILRFWRGRRNGRDILPGLAFGAICVLGMMAPLELRPGLIFDSRPVVLGLSGLFAGPVGGTIAGFMAALYRLDLGGSGAALGIISIITSVLTGVAARHFVQSANIRISLTLLLGFGFLVTVLTLLWFLAFPEEIRTQVFSTIALPMLVLFPPATVALGLIFREAEQRNATEDRLRAISSALPEPVFLLDEDGQIIEILSGQSSMNASTVKELEGKYVKDLLDTPNLKSVMSAVHRTLETGRPQKLTFSFGTGTDKRWYSGITETVFHPDTEKKLAILIRHDTTGIVNAQNAAKIAKDKYQALAEIASDYFWETDANFVITRFHSNTEESYLQGATGLTWPEITVDGTRVQPNPNQGFFNLLSGHEPFRNVEVRLRLPFPGWLRISGAPVFDEDGKFSGYYGTAWDISQSKQMALLLEVSERQFSALFEEASEAIIIFDPNTSDILRCNRAASDLVGYSKEELTSLAFTNLLPASRRHLYMDRLDQIQKEKTLQFRSVYRHKSGRTIPVEVSARLLEIDGREIIQQYARDLTEQENAREAANRHKFEIDEMLNSMADGVICIDEKGIIFQFNKNAVRIFGYEEQEVVGHNISMLMPEPDKSRHDDYIDTYLRTGKQNIIGIGRSVTARAKSGNLVEIRLTVSELPKSNDGTRRFIASCFDLTEQIEIEGRLRQSQKMEAVGGLTGGIAHDFNNLLQIISSASTIARAEFRKKVDIENWLERIDKAVKRGSGLTGQLLAFSRKQNLKPEVINIGDDISRLAKLLGRTLGEDIEMSLIVEDELPPILLDNNGIQNAILNICLNSRAAMPEGGQIDILVSKMELANDLTLEDGVVEVGPYIKIKITDTGTGMEPEVAKRAMEPFFTTKEVGKGSGMGLSMVYGFVKQSGGHFELQSFPGKGTTVEILLPIEEGLEINSDLMDREPVASGGNGVVLVVEDEDELRATTSSLLETLGYQVIAVENALVALDVIENGEHVDIVFSDIVMPAGMSGIKLAERLLERQDPPKILLTSGYPDRVQPETHTEVNLPILPKPYTLPELQSALSDLDTTWPT